MLLSSYRKQLDVSTALRLLIVGKAPFNRGSTGIPFIRADWDEMENPSCSGLYVLQSITGKCIHVLAREQEALNLSPLDFALFLIQHSGVGFINASYSSGTLTEMRRWWTTVNRPIVEKAVSQGATVLLCGDAARIRQEVSDVTDRYAAMCHPDVRNTTTPAKYTQWKQGWSIGKLKSQYEIPDVPVQGMGEAH